MSYKHYPWAWAAPVGRSAERLVLLALADYANDYGDCFPSAEALAERTGLNRKTVFTSIRALEERSYIVKTKRRNFGNAYRLVPTEAIPETVVPNSGVPKTVRQPSQKRDVSRTKNGTRAIPKTVREPTNESTNEPTNEVMGKTKGRRTRLMLKALPDEWKTYCERIAPDLDPQKVWLEFDAYWNGRAKDPLSADWNRTWQSNVRKINDGPDWMRAPLLRGSAKANLESTRNGPFNPPDDYYDGEPF